VLEILELTACFEALVAGEDVTAGKPDPQVFLAAAQRLQTEPSRCIVVEDSPLGIEAARRAGMRSIGVTRKVRLAAADIAVSSLTELPDDPFSSLLKG
jgi:beta-phosphoglucomutase